MNRANFSLVPLLAVGLIACGDDGGGETGAADASVQIDAAISDTPDAIPPEPDADVSEVELVVPNGGFESIVQGAAEHWTGDGQRPGTPPAGAAPEGDNIMLLDAGNRVRSAVIGTASVGERYRVSLQQTTSCGVGTMRLLVGQEVVAERMFPELSTWSESELVSAPIAEAGDLSVELVAGDRDSCQLWVDEVRVFEGADAAAKNAEYMVVPNFSFENHDLMNRPDNWTTEGSYLQSEPPPTGEAPDGSRILRIRLDPAATAKATSDSLGMAEIGTRYRLSVTNTLNCLAAGNARLVVGDTEIASVALPTNLNYGESSVNSLVVDATGELQVEIEIPENTNAVVCEGWFDRVRVYDFALP